MPLQKQPPVMDGAAPYAQPYDQSPQASGHHLNAPPQAHSDLSSPNVRAAMDPRGLTPQAVLQLQSAIGNRATGQLVSQVAQRQPLIQRMIVSVGDLEELENKGQKPKEGSEKYESGKIISDSVKNRVKNTKEKVARPWDERVRPFYWGPLANMGVGEELRIYGHGERYEEDNFVTSIGGYAAKALVTKLIEMGLPATYQGEIYLTGCETAKGDDYGYLGEFYKLMVVHCPKVRVRGNIAISTTFDDGEQGVWSDTFPSLEVFKEMERTMSNEHDMQQEKFDLQRRVMEAKRETNTEKRQKMIEEIGVDLKLSEKMTMSLLAQKASLSRVAYSTDQDFTRTLP